MNSSKKIYFASDFHLGVPDFESSLIREKKVVHWLETVRHDAEAIYLVGDIFDFWFEYKHAVPRGFTRLLGKISEITDSGIPVHVFTGNHDMWIFDYLPQECGVILHRAPIHLDYNGQKMYVGHGDGLGPGDHGYKLLKKVFASKLCQWLFARFHPNFGIWLANRSSDYSRSSTGDKDRIFLGEEKEWLVIYTKEVLQREHFDYFVFGHRHLPMEIHLNDRSKYINIGDWLSHFTYGVWDQEGFHLKKWEH